jgi:glutamate-1-semialdehyde 2,1-aminomutase
MTLAHEAPSSEAGPRSRALFERAVAVLPGGVSSPVRAFRAVGGTPLVIARGEGSEVVDADGRRYLDFVMSWGPLILGHAHPEVVEAIRDAAGRGTSFGAPSEPEIELAETVISLYPGVEQVRFVSSGTEAAMSALRLARGVTGRDLVVKFSGCYHGHADPLLVSAGSGLVTFGNPSSAGVPAAFAEKTIVLPLGDAQRVEDLFAREGSRIAAVTIEPVPANNGLLIQTAEFLAMLRRVTRQHGALLLFDEVISGFRVAPGGAAQHYGITPDLACFGKVIGGGMPVGAFAGSRDVMKHLAPEGAVYQAGTLSGNPVAMAAGLATLRVMQRENGWHRLEQLGALLESRLRDAFREAGVPGGPVRFGSLFWLSLQPGPPPGAAEAIDARAAESYRVLFRGLLGRGIQLAPSAYEVGFLALSHDEAQVEFFASALRQALTGERAGGAS